MRINLGARRNFRSPLKCLRVLNPFSRGKNGYEELSEDNNNKNSASQFQHLKCLNPFSRGKNGYQELSEGHSSHDIRSVTIASNEENSEARVAERRIELAFTELAADRAARESRQTESLGSEGSSHSNNSEELRHTIAAEFKAEENLRARVAELERAVQAAQEVQAQVVAQAESIRVVQEALKRVEQEKLERAVQAGQNQAKKDEIEEIIRVEETARAERDKQAALAELLKIYGSSSDGGSKKSYSSSSSIGSSSEKSQCDVLRLDYSSALSIDSPPREEEERLLSDGESNDGGSKKSGSGASLTYSSDDSSSQKLVMLAKASGNIFRIFYPKDQSDNPLFVSSSSSDSSSKSS